ncbi:hypothetical protein [Amycolatopsis eburnea]|uniref:Uncharacterized protein n=1 Tax=Amycolatopsis eburnea TaxID=2267691 RepID=A0A427TJ06_9PSEU|nr:hypothetical protein [Amycolatopsis eburnea]RSD23918.1 hypothetical protein EIY87_05990 [Amycolatopsis eburnea]
MPESILDAVAVALATQSAPATVRARRHRARVTTKPVFDDFRFEFSRAENTARRNQRKIFLKSSRKLLAQASNCRLPDFLHEHSRKIKTTHAHDRRFTPGDSTPNATQPTMRPRLHAFIPKG